MPGPASSFHEQLRILQSDIETLSQKLHIPAPTFGESPGSSSGKPSRPSADETILSRGSADARRGGGGAPLDDEGARRAVSKVRRELQAVTRERDDALGRLDHAYREMEEMRRALQEAARLRASFDHLRQDHDALRISLESSERIRKQQKALIDLLQKSHTTISDSASVGSYSSSQYGAGGGGGGSVSTANSRPYSLSSQVVAAENREWLNASPARLFAAPQSGVSLGARRVGGVAAVELLGAAKGGARVKPASGKAGAKGAGKPSSSSNSRVEPPSVASTPSRASAKPPTGGRRQRPDAVRQTPQRPRERSAVGVGASPASRPSSASPYLTSPSTPIGGKNPPAGPSPSPAPNGRPPRPHSARPRL